MTRPMTSLEQPLKEVGPWDKGAHTLAELILGEVGGGGVCDTGVTMWSVSYLHAFLACWLVPRLLT
jgi:hypothetical protein